MLLLAVGLLSARTAKSSGFRGSVLSAEAVFMKDSEGVPGRARRASHAAVGPAIQVICLVSDCFPLYLLSWSLLWFGIVFVWNLLFVSFHISLYTWLLSV